MDFALAEGTWRIETPIAIEERVSRWDFGAGWAFRVEDEADRPVGFVVVAEGTWTVRFDRPQDGLVVANRLAVLGGAQIERVLPVARGGDLQLSVDRGLVLGNDAWETIARSVVPVGDGKVYGLAPGADAVEEVLVVDGRTAAQARRIAANVLDERTRWLRDHAFDPGSLLVADRLQPGALRARVAEFRTDVAWEHFSGSTSLGPPEPWLTFVRDPSGAYEREARAVVVAQGLEDDVLRRRVVALDRFAPDAAGVRRAPQRVDVAAASATITWDREATGAALIERAVADLRVTAVGGPARLVWFTVPHVEQTEFAGLVPLPNGYALDGVTTTTGVPLEVLHLPLEGSETDGRGSARTYVAVLPEALAEGETVDLRVSWRDRHRYLHLLSQDSGLVTDEDQLASVRYGVHDLGTTTGLVVPLPRIRTHAGKPAPATLQVGVRPWYRQDRVAISGERSRTWAEAGWRWTQAVTDTGRPAVAVGTWRESYEPEQAAFPAVRALLRTQGPDVADAAPAAVRALLHGWDPLLPPYPGREVGLVELHMFLDRLAIWRADGLVALQPARQKVGVVSFEPSARNRMPHFEEWALALTLHAHWWIAAGDPPGSDDLGLQLSVANAVRTVGAAHGAEEAETWWESIERWAGEGRQAGLWAGVYRSGRTLPAIAGEAAVLEAVDRTLSGQYAPTWEGFEAALEQVSGRQLDDVFAAMRADLRPHVDATFAAGAAGVLVTLEADVPFGSLPVPVRVRGRGRAQDLWIEVRDGHGHAVVAWEGPVAGVDVDPDHLLLLDR